MTFFALELKEIYCVLIGINLRKTRYLRLLGINYGKLVPIVFALKSNFSATIIT